MKVGIGLYGMNGHQIHNLINKNPEAVLIAVSGISEEEMPADISNNENIKKYDSLSEMAADDDIMLISLCSPKRGDQYNDALTCLNVGKNVYAEKPCVLSENELDTLLEISREKKLHYHEMAGTSFEEPYFTAKKIIAGGSIGEVVQVFAQKSYPFFNKRPQDEYIDGGLICQNGIHAVRFIEHVAGEKITFVTACETSLGNPFEGNLKMAASFMMRLENGGVATAVANYLNPVGFGVWGNETLRVFGTCGMIEITDGGMHRRLIVKDKDHGEFDISGKSKNYFDYYIDALLHKKKMPFDEEKEFHPTRIVIRAAKDAKVN